MSENTTTKTNILYGSEGEGEELNYNKDYDVIIRAFFEKYGIIYNQLESFEKFIERGIPQVLEDNNPLSLVLNVDEFSDENYKIELYFMNTRINKPVLPQSNDTTIDLDPITSRIKNCTYSSSIYIDIDISISEYDVDKCEYKEAVVTKLSNINIGKIPIMVGSKYCILQRHKNKNNNDYGECEYDKGGYFIINGSEKVIVYQERIAENQIYTFKNNKVSKYVETVEVKSIVPGKYISPKLITAKILSRDELNYPNCIYITFPYLKKEVPMSILYRALGLTNDKEIYGTILYDINHEYNSELKQILHESIDRYSGVKGSIEAKLYISKLITNPQNIKDKSDEYICEYVDKLIISEFLPHVGDNMKCKALYLGYMVRKLLLIYLGRINYDDRDNYINKRVDTTGVLLTNLFKLQYNNMLKEISRGIKKEFINGSWKAQNNINDLINRYNIYKIFKGTTIENGIKTAIATGNFGSSASQYTKMGVAQLLNRLSFFSSLSHLRRINTPIEKMGKLVSPRKLNGSSFGYICPVETPEGQSVGLLKNLSTSALITSYYSSDHILHKLKGLNIILFSEMYDINYRELFYNTKIFMNGNWIGYTYNAKYVYEELKSYKRNGMINIYTGVVLDYKRNEIFINTDGGRCIRPLYIVEDNKILLNSNDIDKLNSNIYKWDNLVCGNLSNNITELHMDALDMLDVNKISCDMETKIEFLDIFESSNTLIATKELLDNNKNMNKYMYCEIHTCLILGIISNLIPFSHHNQAPRNVYQSAMGKQAIGIYSSKFYERLDTLGHIMSYPQSPVVSTFVNKYIDDNKLPHGQNLIVAVMCGRENQEDSILINKSCVERGLLHTEYYKTYIQKEERQSFNDEEKFCIPNPENTRSIKKANYAKLGEDGFIKLGSYIESGDVIIGKCIPIKKEMSQYKNKDASVVLKNNGNGIVTKVYNGQNSDGYNFVKIQIRDERVPMVGDKLSSRHGQKGIIGQLIPEEDMPVTKDGITPDIVINVHCLPSRMTVAHIHESNFGVLCSLLGYQGDASAFSNYKPSDIYELLDNNGLNRYSNQILYDGITGEQMEAEIFMGITYYQRLKHMVQEKEHSRSTGPIVNLNRQPSEGRTREGGFRFGEMETWCESSITPIQLSSGRSIQIGKMEGNTVPVLSFSQELNGITVNNQLNFKKNGTKNCKKITFEDGRTLTLTSNHKLLTSNDEYIEVENLKPNDRIKCGVTYPELDIQQEINECNGWSLYLGYLHLKTNTPDELLKTLAFMRILGYLITDGHISKKRNHCEIYLGHMLDVRQIQEDLKYFSEIDEINNNLYRKKSCYTIKVSKLLSMSIQNIKGLICGNKLDSELTGFPNFISQDKCPKPIIREFLGGAFGGDGHSPCISLKKEREYNSKEQQKLNILVDENKNLFPKELYTNVKDKVKDYETIHKNSIEYIKNIESKLEKINIEITKLNKKETLYKKDAAHLNALKNKFDYLNNILHDIYINLDKFKNNIDEIKYLKQLIPTIKQLPNCYKGVAFSKTKYENYKEVLYETMNILQTLLLKFGINSKCGNMEEAHNSRNNQTKNCIKRFQLKIKIDIDDLVKFSNEIGFRYCCHKNQRLTAVVSYQRLRENVLRQENIILDYMIKNGEYIKNPDKIKKNCKKTETQLLNEIRNDILPLNEPIIHEYINKLDRIKPTDYIKVEKDENSQVKNICVSKITKIHTSKYFPIIGEYLVNIGAYKWFQENNNDSDSDSDNDKSYDTNSSDITYSVDFDSEVLPAMNLKIIDIRDDGEHEVYDIEVEKDHSYLANGIVSHNCMISHGTTHMLKERMLDVSDKFKTHCCNKCGNFANINAKKNIYECVYCGNKLDFSEIHIPYPCKLFIQELQSMGINPRIFTK